MEQKCASQKDIMLNETISEYRNEIHVLVIPIYANIHLLSGNAVGKVSIKQRETIQTMLKYTQILIKTISKISIENISRDDKNHTNTNTSIDAIKNNIELQLLPINMYSNMLLKNEFGQMSNKQIIKLKIIQAYSQRIFEKISRFNEEMVFKTINE